MIGAGVSGLAAAMTLKEANIDVIVLESSDYIGGRTKSSQESNYHINLGAEYLIDIKPPHGRGKPLKDIADKAGLKTFKHDNDELFAYEKGGKAVPEEELYEAYEKYETAAQWVKDNGVAERSFIEQFDEQFPGLSENKLIQLFLSGFFEEYHGDRDIQSAAFTDEFIKSEEEADDWETEIVAGPFSKICEHMALGLDVRLNHRVK